MQKRWMIVIFVIILLVGTLGSVIFLIQPSKGQFHGESCVKPANGFLIVASALGYNDSASKGNASWPIIAVQKGTTVNIVVCNNDTQTHGFQISYYLTSPTESIPPGQTLEISFVANEVGTFRTYEGISSSTSAVMQNGELVVKILNQATDL